MTLEQATYCATVAVSHSESTDIEMHHVTTDLHDDPPVSHQQQEAYPTSTDWHTHTYQTYNCVFDPTLPDYGIVRSFSTGTTFNTTVAESRRQIGIKDDHSKRSNGRENNYYKALKWSPDGSCLLSNSNDNNLRIFAMPDPTVASCDDTILTPGIIFREAETIYDICWYPGMTTMDPATCCLLSSSRDHPVRLWDAYTGELRCSYTIVDHVEVNLAPNSLMFSLDGSKIYCGLNNMIEIFDTSRPGKDSTKRPTCPTRRSKKGQKGVISSLAFNPDHSNLYAAGSFLKTIGLYDARANELLLLLRDKRLNSRKRMKKNNDISSGGDATTIKNDGVLDTNGDNQAQRSSSSAQSKTPTSTPPPMGAVTQVQFTPDGLHLYSASRQDSFIRCWDIRNTAQVLHRIERPGALTNQRISFDISSDGKWLSTGDMNGDVSIFDLRNPTNDDDDDKIDRLAARIRGGHDDVVCAATFHPTNSMLATSSGQRKYDLDLSESLLSSASSSEYSDSDSERNDQRQQHCRKSPNSVPMASMPDDEESVGIVDNSIRLWTMPGEYVWYVNGQPWTGEEEESTPFMPAETADAEAAEIVNITAVPDMAIAPP